MAHSSALGQLCFETSQAFAAMESFAFTCVTCSLAWPTSTAQRAHYSSDLHRYNAKRKVADLPPVSADVFNDKIAERREKVEAVTRYGNAVEERLSCKACGWVTSWISGKGGGKLTLSIGGRRKSFSSENAQNDHLKSKKHREAVLRGVTNLQVDQLPGKDKSIESSGEETENAIHASTSASATPLIPENTCLFCPRTFTTLETTLKHMSHNHAFYVPDLSYCIDVPGLLSQLAQDISLGNICIFCGHGFGGLVMGSETDIELVKRARRGLDAVRKHMIDKGHCRIPWDTDDQRLELSDFYDFTSSYPDAEYEGDGEAWEDEDDSDISESDAVFMDDTAARPKLRTPMDDDLEYRLQIGETDYELVLPNGHRVGHRALKSVYKQNVMRKSLCLLSCFSGHQD